ncbi:symplekin-like isoform X2 [Dysidea avara]
MKDIKNQVLDLVESSDNVGVKTQAIKFLETLILLQTKKDSEQLLDKGPEIEMSLDSIPPTHSLLKIPELREEAGMAIGKLLQLTASSTISSVNLMTIIVCLTNIAKQRPLHFSTVVQAFELLHANLPPSYSPSQVSSVRKQLKFQVMGLLKQPMSHTCHGQIATLLTDLGYSQADITKNTPKMPTEVLKKSSSRPGDMDNPVKEISSDTVITPSVTENTANQDPAQSSKHSVIEATEQIAKEIEPLLEPEAVTDIVVESLTRLPRYIPVSFKDSYTPIAAAGTHIQRVHLARLLASQVTSARMETSPAHMETSPVELMPGPKDTTIKWSSVQRPRDPRKRKLEDDDSYMDEKKRKLEHELLEGAKVRQLEIEAEEEAKNYVELHYLAMLLGLPSSMVDEEVASFKTEKESKNTNLVNLTSTTTEPVSETTEEKKDTEPEKRKTPVAVPQKLKRIKLFHLSNVKAELTTAMKNDMQVASLKRILHAERLATQYGSAQLRSKIIVKLVTELGGQLKQVLQDFIINDLKTHYDLAVSWLYHEYSTDHGGDQYDQCLTSLLQGARATLEPRDRLFSKLVLDAPKITANALQIIKSYCDSEERAFLGLTTLRDLIQKRPANTELCLHTLLQVTMSEIDMARVQAIHIIKKFYSRPELSGTIEKFALQTVQFLLSEYPTFEAPLDESAEMTAEWTEDTVKLCLAPFLGLVSQNHKLIHELAVVYTGTPATVKRIVLKQIEQPVQSLGMGSPELLSVVESCPVGAETLILRILHILTENAVPSTELVNKVRDLYERSGQDVRFLIPILNGLEKREVVAVLPKLIKLSPNVVKGVFDRIFTSCQGEQSSTCPLTPPDLLIALHNIDCTGDESMMKCVIKATNLCFAEKTIYTQEVLAMVLQQLLEQTPIPTLFMRTVIQSLGICPRLLNFVMTILSKLIIKQVWKQPKVWQGFVKCCEVTKPQSFQILLQLQPRPLENALEISPSLKQPLYAHIQGLTAHQRARIPRGIQLVIEKSLGLVEVTEKKRTKSETGKSKKESKKRKQSLKDKEETDQENEQNQSMETEASEDTPKENQPTEDKPSEPLNQ